MNEIDKTMFWKYEKVRRSGITNMFDLRRVEELSNLQRDQIIKIMNEYEQLSKKYIKK